MIKVTLRKYIEVAFIMNSLDKESDKLSMPAAFTAGREHVSIHAMSIQETRQLKVVFKKSIITGNS